MQHVQGPRKYFILEQGTKNYFSLAPGTGNCFILTEQLKDTLATEDEN